MSAAVYIKSYAGHSRPRGCTEPIRRPAKRADAAAGGYFHPGFATVVRRCDTRARSSTEREAMFQCRWTGTPTSAGRTMRRRGSPTRTEASSAPTMASTYRVQNRGTQTAQDVTVRVWWCPWPAESPSAQMERSRLAAMSARRSAAQDVAPGDAVCFGPFSVSGPSPGSRYIVLARATCDDDRANIASRAKLPCGREQTELVDLVANDNNLAIARLRRCMTPAREYSDNRGASGLRSGAAQGFRHSAVACSTVRSGVSGRAITLS